MLVFLFTDIEGSTRLWEEHTAEMSAVIARHDALLQQEVAASGGLITKHTGDGITAVFQTAGEPLACALRTQRCFADEAWGAIGELRIRVGLHAGAAEWIAGVEGQAGDYFGPPVNCAARIMSAAWGGQILLTPEVTQASALPDQATLLDLGQHLLKNVSAPQQIYQLEHPDLPWHQFPPPRTLSGQSIRQAVDRQGAQLAQLAPPEMAVSLVSATLLPAVLGDVAPGSPALVGNVGVLEDLGAAALAEFLRWFAAHRQAGEQEEIQGQLQRHLQQRWAVDPALRSDASLLLRAVQGVDATLAAATGELRETLARGLAGLGEQFGEFRWMLGDVQQTLAEVRGLQRQQLDLQQLQLARTEELLALHREPGRPSLPAAAEAPAVEPQRPAFLEEGAPDLAHRPIFVARERELAWLEDRLDAALAGQGGVVFVTGGPGRGKTALLDAFARRAMEAHAELLVASGTCNAYSGVGDPYLPFREVLGMLSGEVEAQWAAGTISRDHARRLWAALPLAAQALLHHGPHVVPALVPGSPLLSRARAATPSGTPWLQRLRERVERQPALSDGLEQSHLFQQVTHVLRALAEAHPLLLILDDLQWIDSASAGLLFHLGRRLESCRILVVGTYRPEEVALGRAGERHPLEAVLAELKRAFGDVWLDLAEVPKPEGRHFVDALLETEPNRLREAFRRALFAHTGGHPLFTIELLRTMQERGDLVQDESDCWVEGPALDWETLPARVEGVIEARIGRLEEELRDVLSVASVEGEDFTAQVVARVQEVGERQALRRLSRELERQHRLVREQPALCVGRQRLSRFRFAHALFQQYLYNHLGDGERALLHGEVATVLEDLYQGHPEGVAAIAPQLARHFTEAGDEGHALRYLILAGDGALASYAHAEAEGYCRRALKLAPGEAERAHLLSGLGEALLRQGRFQEAIQTWREGIELYGAREDSDGVARLYACSAGAAIHANDPTEALRLCLEGLAKVEGAPDSPGLARLLDEAARAHMFMAQGEETWPFAQRALEMAERLGNVEMQANALALWGFALLSVEDALEALVRAVELAESNGLILAGARAHNNLGFFCNLNLGDYRAGRQHYRRAAELDGQAGNTAWQIFYLANLVAALMTCGDFEEAATTLSQGHALLNDLTEPSWAAEQLFLREIDYLGYRGEWDEAARLARARQASARERGDDLHLANAGLGLAWAVLDSRRLGAEAPAGTWEEAEATLVEAIEIFDRSVYEYRGNQARAWLGSQRVLQGRLGDARDLLADAREKGRRWFEVLTEAFLQLLAGQIAGAEGRWDEALAALEAATGIFARYGARWYWARCLLDWAQAHASRAEPSDLERAQALLRDAQAAFEEMGIPRYVAVAQDRLKALEADS